MTEPSAKPPAGAPVGLTITVIIAFCILISLGVWQLQRLKWKEGLLARIAALQAAPSQPIGPVLDRLSGGADVGYTRVTVVCPGLAKARFLQLYGLKDGEPGQRLVSACALASGPYGSILVDRGFIDDQVKARPPVDPADRTPLELTGVLRMPDKPTFVTPANEPASNHWYSRDVPAMAKMLDAPRPAPVFLMAETATNPDWPQLTPAPVPTDIPNRHFEYALTWFGLAAALIGVYAAQLWNRRKG
ncbi:SURF1 family protein [Phenylobacterium sp.]|uniref:SURF1 family protein n=1 Tax=Phenylobacterium sp. TaxID=1871053 RepID=UPI0035AEC37D